jgi:DNA polymerase III subunit alpha
MLESLIACGALDSTGATRQGMMEVLERALANGQKTQADAMVGQGSIFDLEGDGANGSGPMSRSHPPVIGEEWPRDELLRREKEVLGLYVSSHPLAPLRDQLARKVDVPLKAIEDLPDGKVVTVGGIVSGLRQLLTKKGDQMAVAELDDVTSTAEVVVFASTWELCRPTLRPDAVVLVKSRVDRRSEGKVQLLALEVVPFEAVPDQEVVRLRVDARVVAAGVMDELKTLIGEYPGQAPVELEVHTSAGPKMLRLGPGFRVRPDGDFLAEARALLGAAALV